MVNRDLVTQICLKGRSKIGATGASSGSKVGPGALRHARSSLVCDGHANFAGVGLLLGNV